MAPTMRTATALLMSLCLVGCATHIPNVALDRIDREKDYTFDRWIDSRDKLDPNLIVLSFSGGGLRAATLAASVVETLKENKLADKIAVISSTSGGSITAGYLAARGASKLDDFRQQFLLNNNTSSLTFRLLPSFISGANRSIQFAGYLDERLFDGKSPTYGDLLGRWGNEKAPFVILNASDVSSGKTFEFTQHTFSTLCSDLAPFNVSVAMAASAAFPFLMTPIPIENQWTSDVCKNRPFTKEEYEAYKSIVQGRHLNLETFVAARHAHSLRFTGSANADPYMSPYREIKYVHLIDGGLSDNLAARALLRTFRSDTIKSLQQKGVRRILLIQVNAKTDESRPMDQSKEIPSWIEIFKTVALNPIDVATELSSFISKEYWVQLIRYANAKPEQQAAQAEDALRFYPVQVDFDALDVFSKDDWQRKRKDQSALKNIETNWTLEQADVKLVLEAGKMLLNSHPCFESFLRESNPEKAKGTGSTSCDKIDVQPKEPGAKLVWVGQPASPQAAFAREGSPTPAPKPSAQKITVAADTLFDSDKATLRPEGKAKLDDLVAKIKGLKPEIIIAIGHADRFGTDKYNQKLSERRAEAVKAYLVNKGIEADRIYTEGKGRKRPVTKPGDCKGPKSKDVIACLQPDRRVEIEVIGTKSR